MDETAIQKVIRLNDGTEKRSIRPERSPLKMHMEAINLHGVVMCVSSTDDRGVVDANTRLYFTQQGSRVFARYRGGSVTRGCLAGTISGSKLVFRYAQREKSGQIHAGRSICEVQYSTQAGLRVIEHFTWATRTGGGTNIFEEVR